MRGRPFASCRDLAEKVGSVGAAKRSLKAKRMNPATVVFQALRMAVNDELQEIRELVRLVPGLVKDSGRFAVITFHSLEDKEVTSSMRGWERGGDFSALWPGSRSSQQSLGRLVYRKAILPSDQEVVVNPAARSARLRLFEFKGR